MELEHVCGSIIDQFRSVDLEIKFCSVLFFQSIIEQIYQITNNISLGIASWFNTTKVYDDRKSNSSQIYQIYQIFSSFHLFSTAGLF